MIEWNSAASPAKENAVFRKNTRIASVPIRLRQQPAARGRLLIAPVLRTAGPAVSLEKGVLIETGELFPVVKSRLLLQIRLFHSGKISHTAIVWSICL